MKHITCYLLVAVLIQYSCNQNPPISSNDIAYTDCYLTKMYQDDVLQEEYFLDDYFKVTTILKYNGTGVEIAETRTYDANQKLARQTFFDRNNELIYYSTFDYFLPDSIIRKNYPAQESLEGYDVYYFEDSLDCPFLGRYTYNAQSNKLLYYYTATTLDSNCSVMFSDFDSLGIRTKRTRYWVNNHKGIHSFVSLPFFRKYNRYALEKVEVIDNNGNIVNASGSYQSVFIYNASDYPIEEGRLFRGGGRPYFKYEYECQ